MGESSMSETNKKGEYDDERVRDGVNISRQIKTWGLRGCGVAALFVLTVGISLVTSRLTMPKVVTFDMKGTMDLFMTQSAAQQLTPEKAGVLTARFNAALSGSLADWQAAHGDIILVKPAVISNEEDITATIRADIARRMQEG